MGGLRDRRRARPCPTKSKATAPCGRGSVKISAPYRSLFSKSHVGRRKRLPHKLRYRLWRRAMGPPPLKRLRLSKGQKGPLPYGRGSVKKVSNALEVFTDAAGEHEAADAVILLQP